MRNASPICSVSRAASSCASVRPCEATASSARSHQRTARTAAPNAAPSAACSAETSSAPTGAGGYAATMRARSASSNGTVAKRSQRTSTPSPCARTSHSATSMPSSDVPDITPGDLHALPLTAAAVERRDGGIADRGANGAHVAAAVVHRVGQQHDVRSRTGSAHTHVPVKPVWPNVSADMRAPHEFSSLVLSAQPSPRRSTGSQACSRTASRASRRVERRRAAVQRGQIPLGQQRDVARVAEQPGVAGDAVAQVGLLVVHPALHAAAPALGLGGRDRGPLAPARPVGGRAGAPAAQPLRAQRGQTAPLRAGQHHAQRDEAEVAVDHPLADRRGERLAQREGLDVAVEQGAVVGAALEAGVVGQDAAAA